MANYSKKSPVAFSPVAAPVAPVAPAPVVARSPVAASVVPPAAAVAAPATIETIAAPVRGMQEHMQEHLREAAEKGLGDSRATYARLKTVAEDANQSLETGYAVALEGVAAIGAKSVDVLRSNTEAGLDFFKALVSVKTLTEALEVQSSHMRKQFEMLTTQGKDLAALAQKVANDTTAPLKANVGKVFARAN